MSKVLASLATIIVVLGGSIVASRGILAHYVGSFWTDILILAASATPVMLMFGAWQALVLRKASK